MSYVEQTNSSRRIAAIAGTGAIQAVLATGIILGLAATGVMEPKREYEPTVNFPTTPPPEPPPPEQRKEETPPETLPPIAPLPPIPLPRPDPVQIETVPEGPIIDEVILIAGPTTLTPPPVPMPPLPPEPPAPAFTPRNASPTNGPGGWITNADYPRRGITRQLEGSASYKLTIGTNGRVSECSITKSTGHRVLDNATCKWVKRRARFTSAMDGSGAQVSGSYTGSVHWQIPE